MKKEKLTIIYICNEYPPAPGGGIGVIVKSIAEGLAELDVNVIVLGFDSTVRKDTISVDFGVHVIRLVDRYEKRKPFRFGRYHIGFNQFLKRIFLSRKLEAVIKMHNADIVESYDWSGPLWKKPSIPLIVRMHGANAAYAHYEKIRCSRMLRFFEGRNLEMADSLCAVSRHIGLITCEAFKIKQDYAVVYNSTDTSRFRPFTEISRDHNKILYVGRIAKRKGLIELFKTINILFDRVDKAIYLELIGGTDDQFRQVLMNLIDDSKRSRVRFLGFIPNDELPREYAKAGLFVMPSRAEAFGLTAIEAMSVGTPVVVTDKASGPEIVNHGVNGYIVDFSKPDSAASVIKSILGDRENLQQVALAARIKAVESFSLDKALIQNLEYYNGVLNRAV